MTEEMRYRILPILAIAIMFTGCCTCRKANKEMDNKITANASEMLPQEAPLWGGLLYSTLLMDNSENVCISPLSAQLAFAMTATGARGETREEIEKVMRIGDGLTEQIVSLREEGEHYEVNIANSIWINWNLPVKERFIEENRECYDAEVNRIPFDAAAPEKINGWCKENTNGKIPSIIDEIKPTDMMYLINALYFKAPWRNEFNAKATKKQDFTTAGGEKVQAEMMHQTITTGYYNDEAIQIVSKPFKERYEMLFILPERNVSISEALAYFTAEYDNCMSGMEQYRVELSLPKFKSEYQMPLKSILNSMGMERAFGAGAEFGGITKKPLYIDDAIQKTFISIDEEGAEAAAVTAVMVGFLSTGPRKSVSVTFDRPFLYAIKDYTTGSILFIGKVGNPNK